MLLVITYASQNKRIQKILKFLCALADQTSNDMILWKVVSDRQLISMSDSKKIMPIADVICNEARERGVTEVVMLDHKMDAKMEAPQIPIVFILSPCL